MNGNTQLMFGMTLPTATKRNAADPRVKQLVIEFYKRVGYTCTVWGKEASAAKRLLAANYTPEQVFGCYEYLKAQAFWSDKVVSLMTVLAQIGEWVKRGQQSHPANVKPTFNESAQANIAAISEHLRKRNG